MNTFVYVLIGQIFIAPHHPQNKTYVYQFPDQKVCWEEAETFLDHYEPPPDGHVAAACVKKFVEERPS